MFLVRQGGLFVEGGWRVEAVGARVRARRGRGLPPGLSIALCERHCYLGAITELE